MNAEAANRDRLYRLPDRGWLGGVCAGLAERVRLDLTAIRIITVILTVGSGGLFALVYLVAWAVMPAAPIAAPAAKSAAPAAKPVTKPGSSGAIRIGLGVTLMTLGILLAFRELGLWWSDAVVWPIVIAAGGAALVLRQIQVSGEAPPETEARPAAEPSTADRLTARPPGRIRAVLKLYRGGFGIAMILAAAILFLYANGVFGQVGDAALVVLAIAAAGGLILSPFLVATARRVREERRQRIRSEERAEVAAHLHDSVLQTLAMIQRRSGDAAEIATLARRQERELRDWLSGRSGQERTAGLASVLAQTAAEVEESFRTPIEAVTVGERDWDRRGEALAAATREALTNAARFSDGASVSLFAELSPTRATVFVRDRGPGFDPDSIPPDRRGVRESIIGRMERHGGSATIRSRPGEGTEIELEMEFS